MRSRYRAQTSGRRRGQRFDADANVVTESLIFLGELDPDEIGDALEDATHYEPTPLGELEALIETINEPLQPYAFYDAGAGMGRALMIASRYPFRQAVGVEVSAALCEVARDNLVRWRARHPGVPCKDLRIKCGDASRVALPAGPLVAYLFNPFGAQTVERFVQRLAAKAEPIFVLYHTALHRRVFDEHAAFELHGQTPQGVVYRKR